MKELTIAIIHWIDSTFYRLEDDFTEDIPTMVKPRTLVSVGILLNESDVSMTICQDSETSGAGNRLILTVPKVSILYSEVFTKKINLK